MIRTIRYKKGFAELTRNGDSGVLALEAGAMLPLLADELDESEVLTVEMISYHTDRKSEIRFRCGSKEHNGEIINAVCSAIGYIYDCETTVLTAQCEE